MFFFIVFIYKNVKYNCPNFYVKKQYFKHASNQNKMTGNGLHWGIKPNLNTVLL